MFGLPSLSNTTFVPLISTDVFFKTSNSCKRRLNKQYNSFSELWITTFNLVHNCSHGKITIDQKSYLPRIDFGFWAFNAYSCIAFQQIVQCLCYTVDGSIHTKSWSLHYRVLNKGDISRWQAPAEWAGIVRISILWWWDLLRRLRSFLTQFC